MAQEVSQAGTPLNYVLKEKEALVREECSRREEFCEQRPEDEAPMACSGTCWLVRVRWWSTSRGCGQVGV